MDPRIRIWIHTKISWLKQRVDHKTDSCDDPRQPAGPYELVSKAEEQPLLDVEPGVKPKKITLC